MSGSEVFVYKDKGGVYAEIFVYHYKTPKCYYVVLKDPKRLPTDRDNWSYYEVTEFKDEDSYFEALKQEKRYYSATQESVENERRRYLLHQR